MRWKQQQSWLAKLFCCRERERESVSEKSGKAKLSAVYYDSQFHPGILGVVCNPFWLCRRALYKAMRVLGPRLEGHVLDFGCGTGPYRDLLTNTCAYSGLEFDSPQNRQCKKADIFYDGTHIPLEDASVDSILSTQTLEHVPNPERIVEEWARVLRPEGQLLLTVPFMWPEHEMPHDFQRYTTNGMRLLLEKTGFAIVHQERLLCDCRAAAQLFQAWLYDVLRLGARGKIVQIALTTLFFAPISLAATALAALAPQNPNSYLDNVILARRIAP